MKPVAVRFDQAGALAQLPDGTLITVIIRDVEGVREAAALFSKDDGHSWSEPKTLFKLPTKPDR